MRSLRELGIPSVAVYSEADRTAPHTLYADEAYFIGPSPSDQSYLRIDRILEVAKESGATAIHPGYGFLSERAAMATACAEAGIKFIGPSPHAISVMGNKTAAREKMKAAGVPIVPGTEAPVQSPSDAQTEARRIGYPLLLKASAGGGGRGMRIVESEGDLEAAFDAGAREALAAFGDGSLYMERFIDRARHIEVQVFADQHGRTIHLNERECSVQRRHQKIIEEAPSPAISEQQREEIGQIAVRAAEAVGYEGAGTIELLLTPSDEVFFLEMNTRLQVEHPVTELISGLDLVELQLRVAAGEALDLRTPPPQGHALEVRIYAESPLAGFRPSPGIITHLSFPTGPGVRIDAAAYEGMEVASHYDPMIAKIVTHGRDRAQATRRMVRALGELEVGGIDTNLSFLKFILTHDDFVAARLDTKMVERDLLDAYISREATSTERDRAEKQALALAAVRRYEANQRRTLPAASDESAGARRWRDAARQAGVRPGGWS